MRRPPLPPSSVGRLLGSLLSSTSNSASTSSRPLSRAQALMGPPPPPSSSKAKPASSALLGQFAKQSTVAAKDDASAASKAKQDAASSVSDPTILSRVQETEELVREELKTMFQEIHSQLDATTNGHDLPNKDLVR